MNDNRLIKVEELEIGDEILVPSNSHLRYYKVLRLPKRNPKHPEKWSGVKCSENVSKVPVMRWKWDPITRQSKQVPVEEIIHICTPENHNHEKLVYGLQWRDFWLVRREIK